MSATKEFVRAAASLAHASPREWDAFMVELRAYGDRKRDDCIHAPADVVLVAQGRAQGIGQLTKDMADAKAQAERIGSR
jgi:hypothetical protein